MNTFNKDIIKLPDNEIYNKYCMEGLEIGTIAKQYNVSDPVITRRLQRLNADINLHNEAYLKNEKELFLTKVYKLHPSIYEYNLDNFENYKSIIDIKCRIHGWFKQKAIYHNQGAGCPKCGNIKNSTSKKYTTEHFIQKSKEIHSGKYDYSKTIYVDSFGPVIIICPVHGEFEQQASIHLSGGGCPLCAREIINASARLTKEEFLEKAKQIYADLYVYSIDNFKDRLSYIKALCSKHGWFRQRAAWHLKGSGCPQCSWEQMGVNQRIGVKEFIERSIKIHDNKYEYNKTQFEVLQDKCIIKCPVHGEFTQQASTHLKGSGCPQCGKTISSYEEIIENYLKENGIEYHPRIKFSEIFKIKDNHELDFYLPKHNIGIEINGIMWHSEKFKTDKKYHLNKTKLCEQHGTQLIHIFTHIMDKKLDIVKNRLNSILNLNKEKIPARKCNIKEIDSSEGNRFLGKYHLQGRTNSPIHIGLQYKDEIVGVMVFGQLRKSLGQTASSGEYELVRFACKENTTIMGGASKLLAHFERKYNPSKIITYADRCWSQGNMYEKLGFKLDHYSAPSYWYVKNNDVYHRYKFAKHTLKRQLSIYDPLLSEWENMQNNGYTRFWDCGNLVFVKNLKQFP